MNKPKTTSQWGKDVAHERYPLKQGNLETSAKANDVYHPQDPQDEQEKGYANDAAGWVRGMGPQSPHPHFDKHKAGR